MTNMMFKINTFSPNDTAALNVSKSVLPASTNQSVEILQNATSHAGVMMTSQEEFSRRRRRVQEVCSSQKVPSNPAHIYTHPSSGVLYCYTPKTGCTWNSVLTNGGF